MFGVAPPPPPPPPINIDGGFSCYEAVETILSSIDERLTSEIQTGTASCVITINLRNVLGLRLFIDYLLTNYPTGHCYELGFYLMNHQPVSVSLTN